MFPQATRVLMEGAPPGLDLTELTAAVEQIEGVDNLHHLHVWELDEQHRALEAHVTISSSEGMDTIKTQVKQLLHDKFDISHSTLEFELEHCGATDCH